MRLTRLAQSTILLTKADGHTLLVDPGKYNLDPGKLTPETFPCADVIVITHKHADHFDLPLLNVLLGRQPAQVITNPEIAQVLAKHNIESTIVEAGQKLAISGFDILAIQTDHVVRGELIINFGIVVSADGKSLYHTSDTRFIEPAMLPPETRTDSLLVPISNRGVVMGIDDALVFSSELRPKLVIPVHYDSPKDSARVDPHEFAAKAAQLGLSASVMAFGEGLEL